MRFVRRSIGPELDRASQNFPVLLVTGPRRAGKTTLLRHQFPKASYHLLEDPDTVDRIRSDPRSFIGGLRTPAILDEVQNVPEILRYVRTQADAAPRKFGQWLLTGSQDAPLMRGVTESLAGRAAILQLLPLSCTESKKVSVWRGGYPEVIERPAAAGLWFRSYVQTYLERDVRAIAAIRDLGTFRRFIALLASRSGQLLNKTDLAAPLGVSVPTIGAWLNILEITGQILLVQPFFENFGKRLVKSPKVYFVDSGLACHLLGLETAAALERSPFIGPLFEGFIAAEIVKQQLGAGRRREIYFFRDQQGLEIDFVVPLGDDQIALVEAKASRTVHPQDADALVRVQRSVKNDRAHAYVVHRDSRSKTPEGLGIRPGVRTLTPGKVAELLERPIRRRRR